MAGQVGGGDSGGGGGGEGGVITGSVNDEEAPHVEIIWLISLWKGRTRI